MPSAAGAKPTPHTVHLEDDVWQRIRLIAFESNRTASDVLREFVKKGMEASGVGPASKNGRSA